MDDATKTGLIARAKEGIGAHDGNDWALDLRSHIALLPEQGFEGLKNILSQTPVDKKIQEYEENDFLAGKEQKKYRRNEKGRILFFFIALTLGAFALLPLNILFGKGLEQGVMMTMYGSLLVAVWLTGKNFWYKHFELWHDARATAESARGSLFSHVLKAGVDHADTAYPPAPDTDLPLMLQKLEYVRRYHIELQYDYYLGRGNQHIDNESRRKKWLAFTIVLGAMAAVPFVVTLGSWIPAGWETLHGWAGSLASFRERIDPDNIWYAKAFLATGTFSIGLEAVITNIFRVNNDLSNSMQYHQTALQLGTFYRELKALRFRAVEEKDTAIYAWFRNCNELILQEHKKWQTARTAHLDPLKTIEDLEGSAA